MRDLIVMEDILGTYCEYVPSAVTLLGDDDMDIRSYFGSSGQTSWLQTQRPRVRFPRLPDFLSSSGSGMGSTQLL
jgi:hypothetical protein